MANKLASPRFKEFARKLEDKLQTMMVLECMDCKARLYTEILETVSDIITFIEEAE